MKKNLKTVRLHAEYNVWKKSSVPYDWLHAGGSIHKFMTRSQQKPMILRRVKTFLDSVIGI